MGLTETELGRLRNETDIWFDSTCDIYRQSASTDEFGGQELSEDASPDSTNVKCNMESGIAHEQERSFVGKFEDVQLFTVTFPALTDVRLDDHLVVTLPSNDEVHLTVQAVLAPESIELERKVIAVKSSDLTH